MTTTGPPLRTGTVTTGPPITLTGALIGQPVTVPVGGGSGGTTSLENLTNVVADNAPVDSVLAKAVDGTWRPRAVLDQAAIDSALATHVADTTPHTAYDDMPSLRLLYENGLI